MVLLFFKVLKVYWKILFIIIYPLILLPIFLLNNIPEMRCLYVVALMAGFWVFEVLPTAVTALIPLVLFPLMGIMNTDKTADCYMKDSNMMFFGGLVIALAVEYCNLHTRVSLHAIKLIGCSLRRLHFGLITLTMCVSMWISNTASTAMMIPIIQAILRQLEEQGICRVYEESKDPDAEESDREPTKVTMCFYIGTAYAASIGGLGCIVGSGTNLAFKGIYESEYPDSEGVTFTSWLLANVPLMLVIMYPVWVWMQVWYMGMCRPKSTDAKAVSIGKEGEEIARKVLVDKLNEMGNISSHEILVGLMFVLAAILWFFRSPGFMPGWPTLFTSMKVKDATAALIVVFLLIVLPSRPDFIHAFSKDESRRPTAPSPGLIPWEFIQAKMHWSLVFLLGGGFALGEGIKVSGMGNLVAEKMQAVSDLPRYVVMILFCALASVATQFTSNVAMANILLPIVSSMSRKAKVHPMFLMMPVCLSCSFAYCLPVATPPNAIAAGPCNMNTKEMIKVGLGVQIISLLAVIAVFPQVGNLVWKMDTYPKWATANSTSHH